MTWPIITGLAFLLLVAIATTLRRSAGSSPVGAGYTLKPALFSPAERSFLGVLEQAVGKHYRIFGKVRIADVIDIQRGLSASNRQTAFNQISAKHFDFVLCNRDDLAVVCAIELDDKSHRRGARQERDAFVVELCRDVGLPLVRIPAKRTYTVQDVRMEVVEATQQRLESPLFANASL